MNSALALHIAFAAVALAAGPWQLSTRLRATSLGRHHWMGRAYVAGVFVGGAAALLLATQARGGFPARSGFAMLAVLWIASTLIGFVRVLERDRAAHRIWMIRSYALTLAAITLRIYLPVSQALGMPFEPAYQAIAWLCWVPNIVCVEWGRFAERGSSTSSFAPHRGQSSPAIGKPSGRRYSG